MILHKLYRNNLWKLLYSVKVGAESINEASKQVIDLVRIVFNLIQIKPIVSPLSGLQQVIKEQQITQFRYPPQQSS